MIKDLFGLGGRYVDRYAGLSNFERYKKMVSKANVDMVLNKFSPFVKAKKLKSPTKTVVSMDDTNIDGTYGPIVFHGTREENKIIVNNERVTEILDSIPKDKHADVFNSMMKSAYIARSDIASLNARSNYDGVGKNIQDMMDSSDHKLQKKADIVREAIRQTLLAAQMKIHGLRPIDDGYRYPGSDPAVDITVALTRGIEPSTTVGKSMMKKLMDGGKIRSEYNKFADEYQKMVDDSADEFEDDMLNKNMPITNRYYSAKKVEDGKGNSGEACEVGNGKMEYKEEPEFVEKNSGYDEEFEGSNDTIDTDDMKVVTKKSFFKNDRKTTKNWDKRDAAMDRLADALYDSLAGRIGIENSENPAKRLNIRAVASDLDDKFYRSSVPFGGKHLSINLIVDTSGSMSGYHIEDAVDVVNCINKLAMRGVIEGNLMLSSSGASAIIKMPINPDLIAKISAHNSGEGFKHTIGLRWKELQKADYNVALTDGQLTDGHIDQSEMLRNGIEVVGLYTIKKAEKDKVLSYTNGLNRWFPKSAVRKNAEELIYYLIDSAILNYDQNPRRRA